MKDLLAKQSLTEEQITGILNAMKEAKVYTTKHENIDERYNKLKTQKSELETQLKERDTQLADLSKNNKDNEALLTQIKDLQALNKKTTEDFEKKIQSMEFDYALDKGLTSAKCKNTKALKALLDMDKIKYQDGKLDGLEEQLNNLKESDGYLFDIETAPGGSGFNPQGGNIPEEKDTFLQGFREN